MIQRAAAIPWRPPGYGRARQGAFDTWYGVGALKSFLSEADDSSRFQHALAQLRAHDVYYEPKLARYWQLYQLAESFVVPDSAVAEFGVYRGATARMLGEVAAAQAPGAELHLFDTFAGMPGSGRYDYDGEVYAPGDLADVDQERVRRLVEIEGVRPFLHVGTFAETLPKVEDPFPLSLTHVDADLYQSIFEACEWAYPRTRPGGVIVFDDYADRDCPGASRAINEFFESRPERPVVLATGQALVVKRPG